MKRLAVGAGFMCLVASAAMAQPIVPALRPAARAQTLAGHHGRLDYTAGWREVVLKDATGAPTATISMTSYVAAGGRGAVARPVVFAFNGGPGASSSALNYGFLGPRQRSATRAGGSAMDDPGAMVDNPDSLVDVADLVLIDPVGTGFSRELTPGGGKRWWSLNGDAEATEAAIRAWLKENGRERSPVYILGESFGGFRAGAIADHVADLNVRGFVFVSPSIDLSTSDDAAHIADLPAFAMAALAHGVVPANGRSAMQVYQEAQAFALDEYAPALAQGVLLPPPERTRIAGRMAALTGLPVATVIEADLRVASQDFLEKLKPGMIVGRIDTRVVAPIPKEEAVPGRIKEANDPALAMGASNVKTSPGVAAYLRGLGVQTDRDYVSLTLDVNFGWNWNWVSASGRVEDNVRVSSSKNLALLMQRRPDTRVLLLGGLYDLATPWAGQQYQFTHAGVPAARLRMVGYPSGHNIYNDATTRKQAMGEVRAFILADEAR